ncbi:hypothetical protein GUJ93_ZPchr0010g8307 [Zizania palustris]|uniref:Uncharacterized protein n=1 Tax=Zizania palustris TaxID=103762 RepID=A0A8J5WBJ3_ZIZPA|nr:hypothetical protein GUJ93_ZPchr0010g8307 [Zizania palustris]
MSHLKLATNSSARLQPCKGGVDFTLCVICSCHSSASPIITHWRGGEEELHWYTADYRSQFTCWLLQSVFITNTKFSVHFYIYTEKDQQIL